MSSDRTLRRVENTTSVFVLVGDEDVAASPAFAALKAEHDALMQAARHRDHQEIARRLAACASLAEASFPMMSMFYGRFMSRLEDEIAAAPAPKHAPEPALQD